MDPYTLKVIYDRMSPAQRYYLKHRDEKRRAALERYHAKRRAQSRLNSLSTK